MPEECFNFHGNLKVLLVVICGGVVVVVHNSSITGVFIDCCSAGMALPIVLKL